MAPPGRPILAIAADGSTTKYPNIRAAVDATGIARGSIALAASKLGARDDRVWKYEDDQRMPDLRILTLLPPQGPPMDENERERAAAFVEALRGDDGHMITEMRLSDGYVNASKMCRSAGKFWGDYIRTEGNQTFLDQLSVYSSIPRSYLVLSIVEGPNEKRGTFVHPAVATHVATWISTEFAARVTLWIEEAKERIPKLRGDYNSAIATLKPDPTSKVEADVRNRVAESEGGIVEVPCEHGRVDVLTPSHVIEVKHSSKYLHALGQVLGYGDVFNTHRKRLHLYSENEDDRYVERAKKLCRNYNVDVTYECV